MRKVVRHARHFGKMRVAGRIYGGKVVACEGRGHVQPDPRQHLDRFGHFQSVAEVAEALATSRQLRDDLDNQLGGESLTNNGSQQGLGFPPDICGEI